MRRLTPLLPLFPLTLATQTNTPNEPEQCAPLPKAPFHPNPQTCIDSSITSPSAWHPWTHQPVCIPSRETPYCVFTSAASPRPHGFSVLTTPDEAAAGVSPLEHALDKPFFAPEKLYRDRPYEVRELEGRGKGAVATRKIGKGRVVLVDYVRVLAALEYPADVTREEVRELLRVAVGRLPEPGVVEGLARRPGFFKGSDGDGDGKEDGQVSGVELESIMATNTFGVTVGGNEYMGLFADLATTLAMTVWAARDIEPGEEITITYAPAGMTFKERQDTLQNVWGFKCQCSLCTAPPEVVSASDARREEIRNLEPKVVELAQQGEFHKALEVAERMFALIDEEDMTDHMGGIYEVPARLYYHIGNLEKALEYTLKVRKETDGYGPAGKLGLERVKMLEAVVSRIKSEMAEKKKRKKEDEKGEGDEK